MIILSGTAEPGQTGAFMQALDHRWLEKPVRPAALLSSAMSLVQRDAASSAPRMLDGVAALVAPFDVLSLDEMPATGCALTPDHRIVYVNPAWLAFAHANDAQDIEATCGLGVDVLQATPEVLRSFYTRLFCASATGRQTGRARLRMLEPDRAPVLPHGGSPLSLGGPADHPLAPSRGAPPGRRVRAARGELPQRGRSARAVQPLSPRASSRNPYRQRRVERIPDFVTRMPPRTSHSICDVCAAFYYP